MSAYNDCSNPCFVGSARVRLANNETRPCERIEKGDVVQCPDGGSAVVLCVVKTHCADGMEELVELPASTAGETGLIVTPWHPVRVGGKWEFPANVATPVRRRCDAVYSFVLEGRHGVAEGNAPSMVIEGVDCVTLGHGLDGDVVSHAYFGSHRIIDDLKKLDGWERGLVEFEAGPMRRSVLTGLVCGLDANHAVGVTEQHSAQVFVTA